MTQQLLDRWFEQCVV